MKKRQKMSEAEQSLKQWGIEYTKQPDGTLVVEGNIHIGNKGLTKLPDLSKVVVKGNFWCESNQLTSLEGAPSIVGGDIFCDCNQLTSLAGAPASVGRHFWCSYNQLTSLAGAPNAIGGALHCNNNPLSSFDGAPKNFKELISDFGEFSSWDAVPEHLRTSPETKEKARLEMRRKIGDASVQKQAFKPAPSIRFR